MLLSQKSVQEELKLNEDQVKKVDELLAKQRESFGDSRDLSREERQKRFTESREASQKAVGEILNEEQQKRYKQISLQLQGAGALGNPEVAAALGLSDEQKKNVADIQTAAREEMRKQFQGGGGDREKFRAAREATNEKLQAVLTPEQKTKWQELIGEPFKGELQGPQRGGDGQRRRRERDGADANPTSTNVLTANFLTADKSDEKADSDKKADKQQKDGDRTQGDKAKTAKGGKSRKQYGEQQARKNHGKKSPHGKQAHHRHGGHRGHHAHRGHGPQGRRPEHARSARSQAWERVAHAVSRGDGHRSFSRESVGRGQGRPDFARRDFARTDGRRSFAHHGRPSFHAPRHHRAPQHGYAHRWAGHRPGGPREHGYAHHGHRHGGDVRHLAHLRGVRTGEFQRFAAHNRQQYGHPRHGHPYGRSPCWHGGPGERSGRAGDLEGGHFHHVSESARHLGRPAMHGDHHRQHRAHFAGFNRDRDGERSHDGHRHHTRHEGAKHHHRDGKPADVKAADSRPEGDND